PRERLLGLAWRNPRAALAAPAYLAIEDQRGVHHADVGQRLREIAEQRAGLDVDFFGEQADVVAPFEQLFINALCFVDTAAEGERFDQPEAADEERALARREA